MPKPPVPPDVDEFLRRPNPAVIATLRPDGSPHTVATWYDWENGHVLVNMEVTRLRLRFMQSEPRVSLTALGEESWYSQVSLLGRVVSLEDDPDLVDIDRLSEHYGLGPYGDRVNPRVSVLSLIHI